MRYWARRYSYKCFIIPFCISHGNKAGLEKMSFNTIEEMALENRKRQSRKYGPIVLFFSNSHSSVEVSPQMTKSTVFR